QIGGLGIMTISTAFALMLGQRISLNVQTLMHKVVGETPVIDVMKLLRATVLVTVIIEFMGAIFLFSGFAKIMPVAKAIYYALFHSVSAFCNAGFSLWTNNLSGFVDSPLVNLSITFLIILGGLGFAVLIDLYHYFFASGSIKRLTLHSKIVLTTTAILIVTGFLGLYIGEYNNSMKGFTVARRVLSSWFQSVTARTAGFNTIDIGLYSSASVLLTVILMFIGASPGSTGGGIKTTTFSVLMLSVLSMLSGKNDLVVFKRKIPLSNAREATTLVTLALAIILTIIFILMLIEPFPFEKILFEAFSAFGTVGLSMGITSQLSYAGKMLITLLMYIGRVGPLTLIYAISIRKRQPDFSFAEETISIG
ncbi:MAG TPA: potassium transporter TrkG, partial [Candidatus Cloacimonas sp.]|nr:potassium transporter TrkG [Candidatus Cloacimonas sp.]